VKQVNEAADTDEHTLRISMDSKATLKVGPFGRGGKNRVLAKTAQAEDHRLGRHQPARAVGLVAEQPAHRLGKLREAGTERAFTSPLNDEHRKGTFDCAGCALPHFTSEMKFDSGTGWPSFFTSIPGHLATKQDYLLIVPRTEYHCVRCGGHQGHLFDDGPPPTGQRWCNNGVAQRFIPATGNA